MIECRLSDFTDWQEIGRGGFSVVSKCMNVYDNKPYAIKRITLESKDEAEFMLSYQTVLEEVNQVSNLSHANIVRYYGCWKIAHETNKGQRPQLNDRKRQQTDNPRFFVEELDSGLENTEPRKQPYQQQGSFDDFRFDNDSDDYKMVEKPSPNKFSKNKVQGQNSCHEKDLATDDVETEESPQKEEEVLVFDEDLRNATKNRRKKTKIDFYIQMELCHETLKQYLERRNARMRKEPGCTLWIGEAYQIAKQLVQGLIFISSEQIIHRDIKPSNIFINRDLQVKYGDFGLVKCCKGLNEVRNNDLGLGCGEMQVKKRLSDKLDSVEREDLGSWGPKRKRKYSVFEDDVSYELTNMIGTAMYASPEQMKNTSYTKKTDYYSLGLVLLEVFYPMMTEMERIKSLECVRRGDKLKRELLPQVPGNRMGPTIRALVREDANERIALDEVLKIVREDELLYIRVSPHQMKAAVEILPEEQELWVPKYVVLLGDQLMVYASEQSKKAEMAMDLAWYRIEEAVGGSGEQRELVFSSNSLRGMRLKAHNDAAVLISHLLNHL
jgi:translation initiation factor 2-alpha kinase 4